MKSSLIILTFNAIIFALIFSVKIGIVTAFLNFTFISMAMSLILWIKLFAKDLRDKENTKKRIALVILIALINSCFPVVSILLAHEISAVV